MKTYKLIKKLPFEGSPEIGYISKPSKEKDNAHYWNHNWFQPKDYPEFWEEVVEKDYEILSYISKLKNCIIEPKNPLFGHGEWNIHSVKRLSDGHGGSKGETYEEYLVARK